VSVQPMAAAVDDDAIWQVNKYVCEIYVWICEIYMSKLWCNVMNLERQVM
jgi:hypothetical protein